MMKYLKIDFTPRRGEPAFTKVGYGNGKNHASLQDTDDGFILPNCCGMAHAGWILNGLEDDSLCRGNGGSYWGYTQDGYNRGQEAKLGAIACWSDHVEFVYGLDDDGTCAMLYSGYKHTEVAQIIERPWPYKRDGKEFLGFIYPPEKNIMFYIRKLWEAIKQLIKIFQKN